MPRGDARRGAHQVRSPPDARTRQLSDTLCQLEQKEEEVRAGSLTLRRVEPAPGHHPPAGGSALDPGAGIPRRQPGEDLAARTGSRCVAGAIIGLGVTETRGQFREYGIGGACLAMTGQDVYDPFCLARNVRTAKYLDRLREYFTPPTPANMPSQLYQRIYAVVRLIPEGRIATYGQVARLAGAPRAARQVGYALAAAGRQPGLPWHRVVNAHGRISRRATSDNEDIQRLLLEAEGVTFNAAACIDLASRQWLPPQPLATEPCDGSTCS